MTEGNGLISGSAEQKNDKLENLAYFLDGL